ncbi:uncharacterized protein LOC131010266 isoform X2 [Salvia miltiorrhiza]|uniref:uncharacterized protein LOC131010266 isoform X2 n=1 Tax=Salvia miltiorrhiza TaxID=226208 RepID=UPI0025ABDC05|nr:uncharacterized protein LOC131010266 isoform X2 [Salvia miltiorrhiza]
MELKLSQSSLPTPIFNPSSFFPKHFALLSQRWKLDIQRIAGKGRFASKKNLVHFLKLLIRTRRLLMSTSFSKANVSKSLLLLLDVLNCSIFLMFDLPYQCDFEGHLLPNGSARLGFHIRQWKTQISSTMPFHQFSIAKAAGSFPILVAVVALCIVCIMGAFRIILAKNSRQKSADKSSNCARWRTALSELRDPDSLDAESAPDSDLQLQPLPDDKEQFHLEDASHGYNKLEGEYEKFLSECGMSSYGYWRGGSPQ